MRIIKLMIFLISASLFGQSEQINFIISVDNEFEGVHKGTIYLDQLDINIEVKIIPGKLILSLEDINFLKSQPKGAKMTFNFSSNIVCHGNSKSNYYSLPFYLHYLNQDYLILNVYNLDYSDNKKYINPLPDKSYNYQIKYPGSPSRIIFKKMRKICR